MRPTNDKLRPARRRRRLALLLIALMAAACACGQKGDLYLPDEPQTFAP